MQFSVAAIVALAAAGAQASYPVGNVTYTTYVTTAYETFCPGPTTLTYGSSTYTVTEATTLTISNCTVTAPVYTTSAVKCTTCTTPSYYNATTTTTKATYSPTGGYSTTKSAPTTVPTAGAGKAAALSGAGLAGVLGLVAYVL